MEKQVPVKIVQQKPVNLKTKKASNKITTTEIHVKQKEKSKQYKAGIKTQKRVIYQRKKKRKKRNTSKQHREKRKSSKNETKRSNQTKKRNKHKTRKNRKVPHK